MLRSSWKPVLLATAILAVAGAVATCYTLLRAPTPHASPAPIAAPAPVVPAAAVVPIDAALAHAFESADFSALLEAKDALMKREGAAAAYLMALMAREERVPLTGTADTFYPGQKTFYGHGLFVPYDLDSLAGRAAWVLDELTFDALGLATGLETAPDAPTRAKQAARAAAWWQEQAGGFSRRAALYQALDSGVPGRQSLALAIVYNSGPAIPGLDEAAWRAEITPRAQKLRHATNQSVAGMAARVADSDPAELLSLKE
jgi:hypothetical protein